MVLENLLRNGPDGQIPRVLELTKLYTRDNMLYKLDTG
jgi:hypothetical protein